MLIVQVSLLISVCRNYTILRKGHIKVKTLGIGAASLDIISLNATILIACPCVPHSHMLIICLVITQKYKSFILYLSSLVSRSKHGKVKSV